MGLLIGFWSTSWVYFCANRVKKSPKLRSVVETEVPRKVPQAGEEVPNSLSSRTMLCTIARTLW